MAALILASRRITSSGKRFVRHIPLSSLSLRRAVHASVYDKNVDHGVRPTLVPDEAITQNQPEKYWGPHPETGVFGPSDNHQKPNSSAAVNSNSVLEEKTFFRPLEDLEKPPPHH